MSKKQQKVLKRIVVALLLLIAVSILDALVEMPWILRLALYLVPYLVIGYDILKKAGKGILKRQVFDENFLMAVATIERSAWESSRKALRLCFFIRSANFSRA